MRGPQTLQGGIFSYVSLESRIPEDHPLRAIRRLVDAALEQLSRRFDGIYAKGVGRPSVPPEQLLRALLLQVLYTIRSERQLIEQIDYNLLYRWFCTAHVAHWRRACPRSTPRSASESRGAMLP